MPWLLVDLVLVLLALVALGVCGLRLWRGVKALGREVAQAGTAVGDATEQLAALQSDLERSLPDRAGPEPSVVASRPPARRR